MKDQTIELQIYGMHCTECQETVQKALLHVKGVKSCTVSFISSRAVVNYDADVTHKQAVKKAVRKAGYKAKFLTSEKPEWLFLILGFILTAPLLLNMLYPMLPLWSEWVLATSIQFIWGKDFYVGSFHALKRGRPNMDVLVCLGTTAAYAYSSIVFLFHLLQPTYFESSATVIMLVLLGRILERRTRNLAHHAIAELYKLQPKTAKVQRNSHWEEIGIDEIKVGDRFQVRPGEFIPIDGVVIEGSTYVDESMLTGESAEVFKEPRTKIYAATQNRSGSVVAQAIAVGKDTALAQIIHAVDEASNTKAPIQKLADTIAAYFTPATVLFSILTFLAWWLLKNKPEIGLVNAVTCLIIACPCALGLATPIVIKIAATLAAQKGIVIKNANSLEKAPRLSLMAFDKTGTLTLGAPVLNTVVTQLPQEHVLAIAAALAEPSEHPLSTALRVENSAKKASSFTNVAGKGVWGDVEGKIYYLGSLHWMEERGLTPPDTTASVALADDTQILALFEFTDTLRPESPLALEQLKQMGIKTVMLTGDKKEKAAKVAREAHIDTFYAEILPQEKMQLIKEFQKNGAIVGMCGDGINDAPTLAVADVSFAMRQGSDIAIQTADITLINNDLTTLPFFIHLSKQTRKKIRQNLLFAFLYNAVFLPVAASGLFNPMIGGALMAASSLTVVLNSLLLKKRAA